MVLKKIVIINILFFCVILAAMNQSREHSIRLQQREYERAEFFKKAIQLIDMIIEEKEAREKEKQLKYYPKDQSSAKL